MLIYYIVNLVNHNCKPPTGFGHILTTFRLVIYERYTNKDIKTSVQIASEKLKHQNQCTRIKYYKKIFQF